MTLSRANAFALVFVAALALYLPALDNGFAYDDVAIIQLDQRVHSLAGIPALFTQGYWAEAELALYRPVTTMSFAVDWTISGGNSAWFLFANALWHAIACVLVFMLLMRFAALPAALAGALLFAVHPVHVEAVANVVGRAEMIAAVFVLAAMLLWPAADAARPARRLAMVGVLFMLALLTKESAIMLPALLVLFDAGRGELTPAGMRDWWQRRAAGVLMLGCITLAYLGVRALVLGGIAPTRVDAALEVTSGADRLLTALQAWPVYLRLLVFPRVLLADYGPRILMPAGGLTPAVVAGGLIIVVLVLGGSAMWLRGRGTAALALLWFPLALLPVSNLIIPIGIIVAERTLYLPSLAIAVAVSILAGRLARASMLRAVAGTGLIALVIALFAARTLIRIPDWRSTDSIFAALLRDRPDSFRAHWHHARLDAVAGRHQAALERYVHALDLWPYRPRLVIETTRAAARAGNMTYARDVARYAFGRWPDNVDAAHLYSATTVDLGDTIAARSIVAEALQRFPGDSLLIRMQNAVSNRMDP
jgi:tetratricopeptide (TPR) repeat protein